MAERDRKPSSCGYPVAHSRSPLIHGYWLKRTASTATTGASMSRRRISQTFSRPGRQRGYAGGNVTIPHKEAAFALCRPARRGRRGDRRRQHALARGRPVCMATTPTATASPPISTSVRRAGDKAGTARGARRRRRGAGRRPCAAASAASARSASSTARSRAPRTGRSLRRRGSRPIGLDALAGAACRRRPARQHDVARHGWRAAR